MPRHPRPQRDAPGAPARMALRINAAAPDVDRDVGDVEDREPLEVDEVDDRAAEPRLLAERTIDQVAGRAADHADRSRTCSAGSTRVRSETSSQTITTVATTAMIGPRPWPRLNAIPLLNARFNWSVQNTSISRSSPSRLTAQCFVSWSATTTPTRADRRTPRVRRPASDGDRAVVVGRSADRPAPPIIVVRRH